MALLDFFFLSMLTRAEGLHAAIAREVRLRNPHAVFPLTRALAEAVMLLIYVDDHPGYVRTLASRPDERRPEIPKRRTMQALITNASRHVPGFKRVYEDLCEAAHFGSIAMWASHSILSEENRTTLWTSSPTWRSTEQAYIACAQTIELAEEIDLQLRHFAGKHLLA